MWWRNLAWRPRLSQDDGHRPCQLWYPSSRSWSNDVDLGALNQPASRRVGHFHPRMQLALIDKLKFLSVDGLEIDIIEYYKREINDMI